MHTSLRNHMKSRTHFNWLCTVDTAISCLIPSGFLSLKISYHSGVRGTRSMGYGLYRTNHWSSITCPWDPWPIRRCSRFHALQMWGMYRGYWCTFWVIVMNCNIFVFILCFDYVFFFCKIKSFFYTFCYFFLRCNCTFIIAFQISSSYIFLAPYDLEHSNLPFGHDFFWIALYTYLYFYLQDIS